MVQLFQAGQLFISGFSFGCAHSESSPVEPEEASRLNRGLVKEAVVFEQGTQEGAVVPELSAPQLRAIWVPEKRDGNRLIEAHREWILQGDVMILGLPKDAKPSKNGSPSR